MTSFSRLTRSPVALRRAFFFFRTHIMGMASWKVFRVMGVDMSRHLDVLLLKKNYRLIFMVCALYLVQGETSYWKRDFIS